MSGGSLIKRLAVLGSIALTSVAAQAADTVYGSNFVNGTNTYSTTFVDGLVASFASIPGNFQLKSQAGISGAGVTGATAGEIDRGESIVGTFSYGVKISNIRLGLLFDGPEYGDVREVAKITAYWQSGGSTDFTLTANGIHSATWTGLGSVSSIGSGAISGGTGAWDIDNPFGNQLVSKLSFSALTGIPAASCSGCSNQSDYTLVSVTAVPEPETYAMLLAGLGLMGGIARRRKQAQAA